MIRRGYYNFTPRKARTEHNWPLAFLIVVVLFGAYALVEAKPVLFVTRAQFERVVAIERIEAARLAIEATTPAPPKRSDDQCFMGWRSNPRKKT
jgi:hypothetical protein